MDATSRFLVIGGLAWDRALKLDRPLVAGGRALAQAASPGGGEGVAGLFPGRPGGGAANASVALARAGLKVAAAGLAPAGPDGDRLVEALAEAGVDTACIGRRPGPEGATLILIDPDGERTIIGVRPTAAPPPSGSTDIAAAWSQVGRRIDAAFADAPPAGVFLRAAAPTGARLPEGVVTVAHWEGGGDPPEAAHVVVSGDDLDRGAGRAAGHAAAVGARIVYLTLGADGADVIRNGRARRVAAPVRAVVDATGAGDVFAAGLLQALSAGADPVAAAAHACLWGAAAVGSPGSAPFGADPADLPVWAPG